MRTTYRLVCIGSVLALLLNVANVVKAAPANTVASAKPTIGSVVTKPAPKPKVARAIINTLQVTTDPQTVRIIFGVTQAVTYKSFTLTNPHRIALDVNNVRFTASLDGSALKNTPVTDIRVAEHEEAHSLRIVLDLTSKSSYRVLQTAATAEHGPQLIVELYNFGLVTAVNQQTPPPSVPIKQPVTIKAPKAPKLVAVDKMENTSKLRPVATNQTVELPEPTQYAPEISGYRDIIVVIDPGHGGKDPGASGAHGTKEKNVVLAISKKLQSEINQQPGFRAYLTRSSDYFIPLRQRLAIARKYKADMFVAIHADAFQNTFAQGASVYALSERGATSEAARWLATSENRSEYLGDVSLGKKDEMLRSVLIDLAQTSTIAGSLQIGSAILQQLSRFAHLHYHKVEQAAFVVLKSPDIPSLLVESGFLSNANEEKRLNDPAYQQKIAYAITQGVKNYFVRNPPRGTVFSAKQAAMVKHSVAQGDSLNNLATHYNVSTVTLKKINHLSSNKLQVGQVLMIPLKQQS